MGAAFARQRTGGPGGDGARRPDQAGNAPVHRRGRDDHLQEHRRAGSTGLPHPARADVGGRVQRPRDCRGRDPPVLALDRPGHLARRALRSHRRGAADAGAVAAHFRAARPRRHAGPPVHDRDHEHGAVLPAAPAGAVNEFAVLDGPPDRPEVLPDLGVPPVPAHRASGALRLVGRVRRVRADAGRHALHRQRQEDLVGRSAAPAVRHPRIPRVRRTDAACRDGGHQRAHPGARVQALPPPHPESRVPGIPPAPRPGEQVARCAVRHRRPPDRLGQEGRGADARPGAGAGGLRRRRGGRTGQPAARRRDSEHPPRRHERRPPAARVRGDAGPEGRRAAPGGGDDGARTRREARLAAPKPCEEPRAGPRRGGSEGRQP